MIGEIKNTRLLERLVAHIAAKKDSLVFHTAEQSLYIYVCTQSEVCAVVRDKHFRPSGAFYRCRTRDLLGALQSVQNADTCSGSIVGDRLVVSATVLCGAKAMRVGVEVRVEKTESISVAKTVCSTRAEIPAVFVKACPKLPFSTVRLSVADKRLRMELVSENVRVVHRSNKHVLQAGRRSVSVPYGKFRELLCLVDSGMCDRLVANLYIDYVVFYVYAGDTVAIFKIDGLHT